MESIKYLKKYYTCAFDFWAFTGSSLPITTDFGEVLRVAAENKANVIIRPFRGKYYYLKAFDDISAFDELEERIIKSSDQVKKYNLHSQSILTLLDYNNDNYCKL